MTHVSPPHYLRFVRAVALVAATSATMAASGCCPLAPASIVCDHCLCPWSGDRSVARPMQCETLGRETECCPPPPVGPLAPPSLSS